MASIRFHKSDYNKFLVRLTTHTQSLSNYMYSLDCDEVILAILSSSQLSIDQLLVDTCPGKQLTVCALLHHTAIVYHHNLGGCEGVCVFGVYVNVHVHVHV